MSQASIALGRTLKDGSPPCPSCKGARCQIFWGGAPCDLCTDGQWLGRDKVLRDCKFCNGGKKKTRVLCHRNGEKFFDMDVAHSGYVPVIKSSSPRAVDARIDLIYSAFLERCYLSDYWLRHLRVERGLSDETIERVGFVTLPDQDRCNAFAAGMAKSYGPLVGVPGFYEQDGEWRFRRTLPHWESGLVIPYRNSRGQIVMLQVRTDSKDSRKRYMCISGAPADCSHAGTGSGAPCHWTPAVETSTVGVTEGGLKGIAIAHHWQRLGYYAVRWVGLCGLTVPAEFFREIRQAMPRVDKLLMAFDREVTDSDAWRSVERVKVSLRRGAAEWGLKVCEEPGVWKGGERKFDDWLGGL